MQTSAATTAAAISVRSFTHTVTVGPPISKWTHTTKAATTRTATTASDQNCLAVEPDGVGATAAGPVIRRRSRSEGGQPLRLRRAEHAAPSCVTPDCQGA